MKRRLLTLLVVTLFAISGVVHVYASTAAAMDTSMPVGATTQSDDMGCCDDGKMTHSACIAMCANAFAVLHEVASITLIEAAQDVESTAQPVRVGFDLAPEPPPPKI
jgi:hypothetical protein